MDAIVSFRSLGAEAMAQIAEKLLGETLARAEGAGLTVAVKGSPAAALAALCAGDPAGARALRHRIQESVESPLAELLLRGVSRAELDGAEGGLRLRALSPLHHVRAAIS
jgi:ATP-dependent Clp protease ATP-binding subunit ClpA